MRKEITVEYEGDVKLAIDASDIEELKARFGVTSDTELGRAIVRRAVTWRDIEGVEVRENIFRPMSTFVWNISGGD